MWHKLLPLVHVLTSPMHIYADLLVKIFDLIFLIMARIRICALPLLCAAGLIEKFATVASWLTAVAYRFVVIACKQQHAPWQP